MTQAPGRKKLRREYLLRKARAYSSGVVCGLLFIPALLLTMLLVGIGGVMIAWWICAEKLPPGWWAISAVIILVSFFASFVPARCAWFCWRGFQRARETAQFPSVPPLAGDTLSVAEILVRGSEQPPVVQSEVLLRAAHGAEESAQAELLRMSREQLLEHGADVNLANSCDGRTPLEAAEQIGYYWKDERNRDLITLLKKYGAKDRDKSP